MIDCFAFLKSCHRRAPFLFFNGNTFAEIGRTLATALFSDLPYQRRKEATSAVAHFITGVLDGEMMVAMVEGLFTHTESFVPGARVRTLRGSARGAVQRVLPDGRIAWLPDGGSMELLALPESLLPE